MSDGNLNPDIIEGGHLESSIISSFFNRRIGDGSIDFGGSSSDDGLLVVEIDFQTFSGLNGLNSVLFVNS